MKIFLSVFLSTFFVVGLLSAKESSVSSLDEVLRIALEQSPAIAAARADWQSAKDRIPSIKSLPDPEIGFQFMGFSRSGFDLASAEEKWYSLSQTFPFPGKLRAKTDAALHWTRKMEEQYRAAQLDILSQVKEAYFNLTYAERAAEIVQQNVEILRNFSKIAELRYATNKAGQPEVLRAQMELFKMQNNTISVDQDLEINRAQLNKLLDKNPETPIFTDRNFTVDPFKYSFADLEKIMAENRPEILTAQHHIKHTLAEVRQSKTEYLPDTTVEYTWRTQAGQADDAIAAFKFTLPFFWYKKQSSMVRSTIREKEHAEAMLRAEKIQAAYELREFFIRLQSSIRKVDLYKTTLLPQAEQTLKVGTLAYPSGNIGFLELLDLQRAWLDLNLDYYKTIIEYKTNLEKLERTVGKELK